MNLSARKTVSKRGRWNPNFNNSGQHDAQEAFQTLLDACNAVDDSRLQELATTDYNRVKHTTPYWHTFGMIKLESVRCKRCPQIVDTYAASSNLQLGITDLDINTVDYALNQSLGEEDLEDVCEECGQVNTRVTTTSIHSWPTVLVLHLKRWGAWDPWTGRAETTTMNTSPLKRYCPLDMERPTAYAVLSSMKGALEEVTTQPTRKLITHSGISLTTHVTPCVSPLLVCWRPVHIY